jgi:hypothetical protein
VTGRRGFVFFVALLYLGALVAVAILYFADVIHPRSRIGTVPTPVPWFGALGAVIVSLTGVFDHAADWRPSYRYWHLSRPFVGATVGVVAVLVFQAGILAVGEDVKPETGTRDIFYYVIAFFIGYKEAAFRDMMARVGEVVLRPGDDADVSVPTITSVVPPNAPAAGGRTISIRGTGLAQTKAVTFNDQEVTDFEAAADRHLTLKTPQGNAGLVVITVYGKNDVSAEHDFDFT